MGQAMQRKHSAKIRSSSKALVTFTRVQLAKAAGALAMHRAIRTLSQQTLLHMVMQQKARHLDLHPKVELLHALERYNLQISAGGLLQALRT
jgi:HD superfamily phosphohydrolase YqeK